MAQKIEYSDNLKKGTDKLNESIEQSNVASQKAITAEQTANQAIQQSESTQTQLDNIVIEGDSSVEAAQARVDSKGESFPTLKSRLDNFEVSATQQLQQNIGEKPQQQTNPNDLWRETELRGVNVDWFGADPTGVNDSSDAFFKALNHLPDKKTIKVIMSDGIYKLTKPLYITRRVFLTGEGIDRTILYFSETTEVSNAPYNAFITAVHNGNVVGGHHNPENPVLLPEGQVGDYAQHSVLMDFTIKGLKNNNKEQNGMFINAPIEVIRVAAVNCSGYGFIEGANGEKDGLKVWGNANHTKYKQAYTRNNGKDGFHIFGADANTFVLDQCIAYSNDGWGIFDDSLIGGVVIGAEADGNLTGAYGSSFDRPSRTVWLGTYAEENHPIAYLVSGRHLILGATGALPQGGQPYFGSIVTKGTVSYRPMIIADSDQLAFDMGGTTDAASRLSKNKLEVRTAINKPMVVIEQDGLSPNFAAIRVGTETIIALPYDDINNVLKKGRPMFRKGFAIGQNISYEEGTGPPTSGTWSGGQRFVTPTPTAGSFGEWVCVNGGTPGIWKGNGKIEL